MFSEIRRFWSELRILGLKPQENDRRNEVERMLDREIHDSEGLRALILTGVFALSLAAFLYACTWRPEDIASLLPLRAHRLAVGVSLSIALLVVALIKPASVLLKRGDRPPPLGGRLISAFLETSLPTAMIFALTARHDTAQVDALFLPPAFFYFPLLILSILRFDRRISIFTGLVAGGEYAALAWWIFARDPLAQGLASHFVKAGVLVLSGVLAGEASSSIRAWIGKSYAMVEERKRTLDRFGQFVSPEVAAKLLDQKDLGSEVRHVCVMFLDIRDFTAFSEKKGPEEVVRYLNSLFGFMIDSINAHHGIINKFLGDGFMAVFGAPISDGRDCSNALAASREILAKLSALASAGTIPPTRVGIGLHTGPAVTGIIGTLARGEYTVIGDVVNLASRIEALNKDLGSCLLVSDEVLSAIGERPGDARARGAVKVKGREAPVELFQLG